jgi:hypothetical protein
MIPLFIAYYTPEYAAEASELRKSLVHFGVEHDVRPVLSRGSWQANTQRKAEFVREMADEYPGRPLVYVDADARIRQWPSMLYSLDCDFAACWRTGNELLSGTLYFGPTAAALSLIDAWIRECGRQPLKWDQRCLQDAVDGMTGLRIVRLPFSYTRVFDGREPDEPIIEHMQASRRLATLVG